MLVEKVFSISPNYLMYTISISHADSFDSLLR